MENKGSQGATLSPVKLWSGTLKAPNTLTLPELNNYSMLMIIFQGWRKNSKIIFKGTSAYCGDASGSEYNDHVFEFTGNSIKYVDTYGNLLEVIGIKVQV